MLGLERNEEAPIVKSRGRTAVAYGHGIRGHGWVTCDDFAQKHLAPLHIFKRHILTGFRDTGDHPSVLLREEALGNDEKEINCDTECC
jgi:hypothetical protein